MEKGHTELLSKDRQKVKSRVEKMNAADLVVRDVSVYNTVFRRFYPADVYILEGRIYSIDLKKERKMKAGQILDGSGKFMVPGLIDIHMHIESSMMTPNSMAERLAQCGVTTVVSEPHEMANVNGLNGILDMMEAGKESPIDIYYGIPSCVPSTSSELETTGGVIGFEAMKELLKNPLVACMGEVMNYRQIIRENQLEISKMLDYLSEERPDIVVEGHCPSLLDLDLDKFIYLGIDSDHTEHNMEELKQRFFNGMFIEIQEKMLREEVLAFIEEHHLYGYFGFVTDDVMADTLMEQGHLDAVVRKAIRLGMSPECAIYHATFTNAMRMKFTDRTMLTPGKLADFVLLDELETFRIAATFKRGRCVYQRQDSKSDVCISRNRTGGSEFPESYRHTVHLPKAAEDLFSVYVPTESSNKVLVEVMVVSDGSTKTGRKQVWLPVKNGEIQWEDSPYLLAVVFERYGKTQKSGRKGFGNIGYGFVTGDLIKHGAAATTYAHDHHNLLAAGSNKKSLQLAVNTVIENQGGIAVTDGEEVKASLKLEIGGILSDAPAEQIGADLRRVREALCRQGYQHYNPIMSFCTLSLLASPALKISDKGIIDVAAGKAIPLVCGKEKK
ncbi:adenine deaminase C-terminal domain-containing protein [Faecalicatena sp.]|uniref:adenine deaminase C-terminal domain-containing protein n=1 Tax=Faecalicatena sp. TaxID=2005360 RepID=UPI002A9B5B4E|nr:adenine deaminase C-terminal domain-containing protein [Lachnospiraceae bacterium]